MFGPHIHKGSHKTYVDAIKQDIEELNKYNFQLRGCQIFLMGPQNTNMNFTNETAMEFGKFASDNNISVVVHNSYLVSLWNNDKSRRPFARMNVQKQLTLCDEMGAKGFIIHLPNDTVDEIISELKEIHPNKFKTPIYLETKATKPTNISYEKPERLNELYMAIAADSELNGHIGHCIDTAHLWSSGVSMTDKKDAIMWLTAMSRAADGYLVKNNMLMFHLNDAQNDFGSGKDVHEALTLGKIWGADQSGLKVTIDFIKEHNLIAILERNKKGGLNEDCAAINKLSQ